MKRRQLRRVVTGRLDTRVADVAAEFDALTNAQKSELIHVAPEFYFAAARMTRMRQILAQGQR